MVIVASERVGADGRRHFREADDGEDVPFVTIPVDKPSRLGEPRIGRGCEGCVGGDPLERRLRSTFADRQLRTVCRNLG